LGSAKLAAVRAERLRPLDFVECGAKGRFSGFADEYRRAGGHPASGATKCASASSSR